MKISYDDYDALLRMIDRLLSMDVNLIFIFILTPFPKTKLHERMLDQGRILSSDWSLYDAMNTVIKLEQGGRTMLTYRYQ